MTYEEFKQKFLPEFLNIRSFAGKIKFADQYLQRIGSGSGRIVYDIDGQRVLKLAKNAKGIAQNEAEAGAGYYRDTQHIVTEVFDNADDDSWLISEKGKKVTDKRIRELTGIPSLEKLYNFLKIVENDQKPGRNIFSHLLTDEEKEFFWENEFSSDLADFAVSYGQTTGDMGRPSSYGEVLRDGQPTIILTDYGLNDEVYSTHYSPERKQKYRMYELFNYADGNDDILSNADGGNEIRTGIWALTPYDVGDGQGVFNEEFVNFVSKRNEYPDGAVNGLPVLTDAFHECVNNIKEVLKRVDNKKQFYNNLLELQNYLIRRGFYDRDPLLSEEYQINEDVPAVEPFSLDDENYANKLANAVASKLNLATPKILGGGANGFAYLINGNLVMKLTADISEADAASKLMRGRPNYIAKIFHLYKVVDSDTNKSYFVIMQENIADKPLDKFRRIEEVVNTIQPAGMDYVMFLKKIKIPAKFNYDESVEIAKHVLTDNPEANIAQGERQDAYDFLVGMTNIRKELLDYQIKSTDYTEIKNLGYKDGVLKFFDTGGYHNVSEPEVGNQNIIELPENVEIDEDYSGGRNRADAVAKQIAQKFGNVEPHFIGSGFFGMAYDIGDDKVLKVTSDKSEAFENINLIGRQLKYIAQPYNVFEITSTRNPINFPKSYGIVLEKLKTDPNIKAARERLDFAFEKIMEVSLPDVIEYYLGDWDDGRIDKQKIESYFKKNPRDAEFFSGLLRIAEEARALGIESMVYLNADNLGYKKNGALGFFDVGFGNYFNEPENIEKIGVNVDEDATSKFTTDDAINQDGFPPYNTNDTSPSINNDLDANTASQMYEDLEYNHVVGDATDDEYKLSEDRKKSWVKGSQAVNVKKKCRLGGLGNTSVACNQGDINNLEFSSLDEAFSTRTDYWGWVSPDNRLIQVPKLKHQGYIMNQYKDEPFGWDYDRVFDKAIEDGWVRVTYEYDQQRFRGDLSLNGYSKERVVEVFKKIFYDSIKYGYFTVYLEWENPTKDHLVFNTRDTEGKTKLVNYMNEYYSSLVPEINEGEIMSLQDLPFKQEIEELGGKIFSVGGAVRDEFLGKPSKDLDILITGIPFDELEQILGKYGRVDAVGKSFGIIKFKPRGATEDIDVAIPRTERPTGEGGHKGFEVSSSHDLPIEKDLERRDFTINAIAKDADGNIVDPFGGQKDLNDKIIRIVNPEAFSDDPLRMLRAVQFASRFGFTIEPKTMQMIKNNAAKITEIAPERILIELDKIITKGNSLIGVQLLSETGLFKQIFGNEIKPSQIGRRDFGAVKTMAELLFLMMNGVVQNPAEFYLKRFSTEDAKRDKIYKELQALDMAFNSVLADQLMSPVKARSIAHNMYKIAPQTLESQILPEVIKKAGQELLSGKYPKDFSELAVNGNDLMNIGLQGKAIGDAQKRLLLQIYSDNVRNNKEELLSLLKAKENDVQEGYAEYNDIPPSTWNVNGKRVGIDFFVREYDKWNKQGGMIGYREASKASVLEFLQNNYEDFSNNEKLKRELYWALTDRDLLKEDELKKVNYSAVVLDKKSRDVLIKVFKSMIPEGWEIIAHHMTIKMGALENGSKEKQDMENDTEIKLNIIDYATDNLVMAVGVEGYPTTNAKPHITVAVNRAEGGKPFLSNKLTDWKHLGFPLTLTGKVSEE